MSDLDRTPGICPGCGGFRQRQMRLCALCARARKAERRQAAEVALLATPEPEPTPLGPYRCREHHEEAVTFKGRGCVDCAAWLATRPIRRRKPRPQPEAPAWSYT